MRHQDYIVTTTKGRHSRTLFWDGIEPLAIDHPVTWQLERVDDQVQAIYLPEEKTLTFSTDDLEEGRAHELPVSQGIHVSLRRVKPIQPVYHPAYYPRNITRPPQFFVFSGQRYMTTGYDVIGDSYRAKIEGKPIWGFVRNDMGYQLTAFRSDVKIKLPANHRKTMSAGVTELVKDTDFIRATIAWEGYWWRVNRIPTPDPLPTESLEDPAQVDRHWLKRMTVAVAAMAVAGFVAMQVMTKDYKYKKIEIPEQPKTIALKPPKIIRKPAPKAAPKAPPPKIAKAAPKPKPPEPPKKPPVAPPKQIAKVPPPVKPKPAPKAVAQKPPPPKPQPKKPDPKPAAPPPKIAVKPPAAVPPKPSAAPARTSVAPPAAVAKAPPAKAAPVQAIQRPTAAQETAKKQAQLARALNFLSPSVNKKASGGVFVDEKSQKYNAGGPAVAGAVPSAKGPSILNTIASNSVQEGVISTTSARQIYSDKLSGIGGAGVPGGKGKTLNEVQGKVSLAALYDPNAGASLGSSLSGGGGGLSMSGPGRISESAIQQALSKHLHRFQYCYEKALLNDPTLGGTITMQWNIQTSGAANSVKVARSQMKNAGLHSCMSQELTRIRFPAPKGGSVTVKFPFSFSASTL